MSENWKERMLRQARLKGMCGENLDALSGCTTREDAIALYKKTIDWALESGYPSLEDIREYFPDCESYGVFVDHGDLNVTVSKLQVYVFHNCKGTVNVEMDYENAVIPMLYFANGCDVKVVCRQPNIRPIRVPLYICDGCEVEPYSDNNACFRIYNI